MKNLKKIFIVLLLFAAVTLFGCSGGALLSNADASESRGEYFVGDQLHMVTMTESEDGYYFLGGARNDYLFFLDGSSMKSTVLCNKPNCLHYEETDDEKKNGCNAFLGGSGTTIKTPFSNIVYFKSYLYVIIKEFKDESSSFHLYRISSDGTQREDVLTFDCIPDNLMIYNDYLYFVTSDSGTIAGEEATTQSKARLCRINISGGSKVVETVYENIGIWAQITNLTLYQGCFYFTSFRMKDSSMQEELLPLMKYDIGSGRTTEICEKTGKFGICRDKIVYYWFDGKEGRDYMCDLDGSNKKLLEGVMGVPYCDDKYIMTDATFLAQKGLKDSAGKPIQPALHLYDGSGKELQSFSFGDSALFELFGSDNRYILLKGLDVAEGQGITQTFWYIDKEKVAGGNATMVQFFALKQPT